MDGLTNFSLIDKLSEAIYLTLYENNDYNGLIYFRLTKNNERIYGIETALPLRDKDASIQLIKNLLLCKTRFLDESIFEYPKVKRVIREEKLNLL